MTDLNPGGASSSPHELIVAGGSLYFVATEPANGEEVWRLVGPAVAPEISSIPRPLMVGGSNTIAGTNLTDGSVVMLFVATAAGPVAYGPFSPTTTSPTLLTLAIPPTVALGNGFASVQVINTDQSFTTSNIVPSLLVGDPFDNIPTITHFNGVGLAPPEVGIGVAHSDVVVRQGTEVTITGTGFNNPLVNLFTAAGNVGPLAPLGGGTATQFRVVVPAGAPTGPGNFQVVNAPYDGNVLSNAVAAVIGARPAISSVTVSGDTVTVNGAGFSSLSVVNLFNVQGGGVVNLGGFGPSGPRVPLTIVSDSRFTFARPLAAVAGRAFVAVLNPPFIPFSSSSDDPDGAFLFPAPAPNLLTMAAALSAPAGGARTDNVEATEAPVADSARAEAGAVGESVHWTSVVLDERERRAGGSQWAGSDSRSTRALVAGDGGVMWRAPEGDLAVGLTHDDRGVGLARLQFALRTRPRTSDLLVYESGRLVARVGPYEVGDRLAVRARAGVVEYVRNDVLLWTSAATLHYPLVAAARLISSSARVVDARLEGELGTVVTWRVPDGVQVGGMRVTAERATTAQGPVLGAGSALEAGLRGEAALGIGAKGCDYCIVSTPRGIEVRAMGTVRGRWTPEPSARYRIDLGAATVRYWRGEVLLDEVPTRPALARYAPGLCSPREVRRSSARWCGRRTGPVAVISRATVSGGPDADPAQSAARSC